MPARCLQEILGVVCWNLEFAAGQKIVLFMSCKVCMRGAAMRQSVVSVGLAH